MIITKISHFVITPNITKAITRREQELWKTKKSFSERNKAKFCKALRNTSWDLLYSIEDAHDAFEYFDGVIQDVFFFFFREDDLLTCKKSTKQQKTKQQHKSTWQKIDNISLALMKQFNLSPVASGMLTITHDQNIIYTSKYIYK